jgi:hypothetical protein
MKSLGQIACEAFHAKVRLGRATREEAWATAADAVSAAIFDRLGEVLDEGDEEPEAKETA